VSGKVLIVDPVVTNRIVMKVKLSKACYQVVQAASGAEALEAARMLRPDLIVCAARLPDMDAETFAPSIIQAALLWHFAIIDSIL